MGKREKLPANIKELMTQSLGFGAIIARVAYIDIPKGAMLIKPGVKCMWTTDKCRITVSHGHGTTIAECSKTPDPECPIDTFDEWKLTQHDLGGES